MICYQIEDKYDERTRELIAAADAARKNYEDVDRQLRDLDREMKDIKDVMEKDFGEIRSWKFRFTKKNSLSLVYGGMNPEPIHQSKNLDPYFS